MRLTSTSNPNSVEENIPVAIFRYNGQRKFLRLAQDYEDMVNLVLQAFRIDNGTVSLHTSSFDACKGESVEVDESAYALMCAALSDIDVIIDEEGLLEVVEPQDEDAVGEGSLPTPTASASDMPSSPLSYADADTTARDAAHRSHTAASVPPSIEDDEEREVEQMDEFLGVHEDNEDRDVFDSRPNKVEVQQETRRAAVPIARTGSRGGEGTPNRQKFKPVLKASAASTPADDYTPTAPQVKKEKESATPDRSTKDLSKRTRTLRRDPTTAPAPPPIDPDARFELSIDGPGPTQVAQFKTRGKHTVGKVLGAACKTFGVDPSRARLCYTVLIPSSDGTTTEECEVECHPDETMAQFGTGEGVRVFVRLGPLDEEEEEEEEEGEEGDDLLSFH